MEENLKNGKLFSMDIFLVILSLTVLIFSAILHEIAHGYVADRLGDPTARISGRLTLNPLKHIDPMMSIILPLLLLLSSGGRFAFGGAKPVPVDPFNLKEGRKDLALVSLAGPLTNILLAVTAAFFIHFFVTSSILRIVLLIILDLNLWLAIFNLLPIPPLDGSKIFSLLLSEHSANRYLAIGEMGTFILLLLLFFPLGSFSLQDFMLQIHTFLLSLLGF